MMMMIAIKTIDWVQRWVTTNWTNHRSTPGGTCQGWLNADDDDHDHHCQTDYDQQIDDDVFRFPIIWMKNSLSIALYCIKNELCFSLRILRATTVVQVYVPASTLLSHMQQYWVHPCHHIVLSHMLQLHAVSILTPLYTFVYPGRWTLAWLLPWLHWYCALSCICYQLQNMDWKTTLFIECFAYSSITQL